jgi:hypothetical protein
VYSLTRTLDPVWVRQERCEFLSPLGLLEGAAETLAQATPKFKSRDVTVSISIRRVEMREDSGEPVEKVFELQGAVQKHTSSLQTSPTPTAAKNKTAPILSVRR